MSLPARPLKIERREIKKIGFLTERKGEGLRCFTGLAPPLKKGMLEIVDIRLHAGQQNSFPTFFEMLLLLLSLCFLVVFVWLFVTCILLDRFPPSMYALEEEGCTGSGCPGCKDRNGIDKVPGCPLTKTEREKQ